MVALKKVAVVELIILTIISVLLYLSLSSRVSWLYIESQLNGIDHQNGNNVTIINQYSLMVFNVNPSGNDILIDSSNSQTQCSYSQIDNNHLQGQGGYCLFYNSISSQLYLYTSVPIIDRMRVTLALVLVTSIIANPIVVFIFTSRLCIKNMKNRGLIMCILWGIVLILPLTFVLQFHLKVRELLATVELVIIDASQPPSYQSYKSTYLHYDKGFWLVVTTIFLSLPSLLFRMIKKIKKRNHGHKDHSKDHLQLGDNRNNTIPIIQDIDGEEDEFNNNY